MTLTLPNFHWRRRAIFVHDLHHILTGYPCTMRGEFQLAVWEFAAGRFPHVAATLFCLPLVAMGFLWSPSRMFKAYRQGCRSRSLYGLESCDDILRWPVAEVRDHYCSLPQGRAGLREIAEFGVLLLQALLIVFAIPTAAVIVGVIACYAP
jgi:hypothetical protein